MSLLSRGKENLFCVTLRYRKEFPHDHTKPVNTCYMNISALIPNLSLDFCCCFSVTPDIL